MTEKKTKLKPSSLRREDLRDATRRAREFVNKLAVSGRFFSDSTEIIRADRDSRV